MVSPSSTCTTVPARAPRACAPTARDDAIAPTTSSGTIAPSIGGRRDMQSHAVTPAAWPSMSRIVDGDGDRSDQPGAETDQRGADRDARRPPRRSRRAREPLAVRHPPALGELLGYELARDVRVPVHAITSPFRLQRGESAAPVRSRALARLTSGICFVTITSI